MHFFIKTLGCKMNYVDSARITAGLQNAGHTQVLSEDQADTIFVNSCTVTRQADRKSRQEGYQAERAGKQVVLFGCGPKVDKKVWQEQFPDQLVFSSEVELLDHFGLQKEDLDFPQHSRTRMPIAIQSGCDNVCSFCITTVARGDHFSLPLEGIIRQIQRAEEHGVKEIILTGINLAAWGSSNSLTNPEEARLGELLQKILKQTSIPRIRISSIGPQFIHQDFYDAIQDERICDHLHISVQSGSDGVLKRMNRGHLTQEVNKIVEQTRKIRPHTALTADIIVGFPGETDVEFLESLNFFTNHQFAKLHVFPYSIRSGTGAAKMKAQVPEKTKKERAKKLREAGEQLKTDFISSQIDRELEFLVEQNGIGISPNNIKASFKKTPAGTLVQQAITKDMMIS